MLFTHAHINSKGAFYTSTVTVRQLGKEMHISKANTSDCYGAEKPDLQSHDSHDVWEEEAGKEGGHTT